MICIPSLYYGASMLGLDEVFYGTSQHNVYVNLLDLYLLLDRRNKLVDFGDHRELYQDDMPHQHGHMTTGAGARGTRHMVYVL